LGGGRVGFLDFGCTKILPRDLLAGMKRYVVALQEGKMDDFYRACVEVLGYDPDDKEGWQLYTDYTKLVLEPLARDAPFKHTHEGAREAVAYLVRHGKKIVFRPDETLPNLPKPIHMPPDFTFVNRLQWGLSSVMAGLGAEANWRRITEPWLHGQVLPLPR
jgi:hypothetical protein